MALRWINSEHDVKAVPHQDQYQNWIGQLSAEERAAVFNHINDLIDRGGEIHTSSFVPGPDWRGTPLQVIYERLTKQSHRQAGWCFGLMMMQAIIDRPERWHCMRPLRDDDEGIFGTVYWLAKN